ncbi:hypothetical protein L9F63_021153, partial [Diploptera punctata]
SKYLRKLIRIFFVTPTSGVKLLTRIKYSRLIYVVSHKYMEISQNIVVFVF